MERGGVSDTWGSIKAHESAMTGENEAVLVEHPCLSAALS